MIQTLIMIDFYNSIDFWKTSGRRIEITGVQLEKGTIATPFEFRPYGLELHLCQRYYQVRGKEICGYYVPGGFTIIRIIFPVQMRSPPTYQSFQLEQSSNGTFSSNNATVPSGSGNPGSENVYGIQLNFTHGAGTSAVHGSCIETGNIRLSAEL